MIFTPTPSNMYLGKLTGGCFHLALYAVSKYWLLRDQGDTELRHLAGPLNHRHSGSSVVIRADRKLLFLLINHSEYSPGNYFLFPACADVPSSPCSPQSPQPGAAEISSGERNSAQQG